MLLANILCISSYSHADVWADRHGTISTAGNVDTGTRYNPSSALKPPLALLWSHVNWGGAGVHVMEESSPVVANGIVYVGSMDGKLYAWDTATGAPITGFPVSTGGIWIESSPAVANNIVYVGSYVGNLYAWNAGTGVPIAGFPVSTGGIITSSPAIANGIVYVSSYDGNLYAWNAATGVPVAGFPVSTGSAIESSPAVANGIVYVGSDDYKLYAWNAATGVPVAGFPVSTSTVIYWSYSSPAIANGIVYVGSYVGNLYAWNASTGIPVAGFPVSTGNTTASSPTVANGYIYIGDQNNTVNGINITSGIIEWQYVLPSNFSLTGGADYSSPAIAENKLFMTSFQGNGIFVFCMASPTMTPTYTVISNTFTATPGASATYSPTITCTQPSVYDVGLTAHKTAIGEDIAPGAEYTYTLELTNNDAYPAENIRVWDTIPGWVSFVSAGSDAYLTISGNYLLWELPAAYVLNHGDTARIMLTVKISSMPADGVITNVFMADYNDPVHNTPANRHPPVTSNQSFYPGAVPVVFPNPFSESGRVREMKFTNITPDSNVNIYTLSGERVRSMYCVDITVKWDLRNNEGAAVSPGIYYYVINNLTSGQVRKGKIFIIR